MSAPHARSTTSDTEHDGAGRWSAAKRNRRATAGRWLARFLRDVAVQALGGVVAAGLVALLLVLL